MDARVWASRKMVVLRFLGIAFLALCAWAGAFLLAYAAILCGWIVYADYSGSLGKVDGSDAAFALLWAPLGALVAGLLAAGSVVRMHARQTRRVPREAADGFIPDAAAQSEDTDSQLERRLGEHAALLKQLQAISMQTSQAPSNTGVERRRPALHVAGEQRRVA